MRKITKIFSFLEAFIKTYLRKISVVMYYLLIFTSASFASADLPPGRPITFVELDAIIYQIVSFLIRTSVVLAVIYIIWSGITYMNAGADTTKVGEAQARLKAAIVGAAIVLGVGVIIQTVLGLVTRQFFCTFSLGGICIVP